MNATDIATALSYRSRGALPPLLTQRTPARQLLDRRQPRRRQRAAPSMCALRPQAALANGPMRAPANMATSSTSSNTTPRTVPFPQPSQPLEPSLANHQPSRNPKSAHQPPPHRGTHHPTTRTLPASKPPATSGHSATPSQDTHAETYLHARDITTTDFSALRFHDHLLHYDGHAQHLPALVAAVTDNNDSLRGVQRTWLDPKQPTKAHVSQPRKALGHIYGLAVRFPASLRLPTTPSCSSAKASKPYSRYSPPSPASPQPPPSPPAASPPSIYHPK